MLSCDTKKENYEIPIQTGLMIDTDYEFQIAKNMFKVFSTD